VTVTLAPVLLPLAMAVVVFLTPSKLWRPRLLAATAVAHFAATVAILAGDAPAGAGAWLRLDAPGRLLLGVVSLLFLACAVYSVATCYGSTREPSAPACSPPPGNMGQCRPTSRLLWSRIGRRSRHRALIY
jgi:hydrogenase-4 component F